MVGEPVGKVAVAGRTEPGDNGGHAKNHHDHRPTNARICRNEYVARNADHLAVHGYESKRY
jgi:hypothetical protein